MNIKIGFFYFFLLQSIVVYCKKPNYNIDFIDKALFENAKLIIRNQTIEFEISSERKAIKKVHIAKTILNEKGKNNSFFIEYYDIFSKISNINGCIYDKNGKKIKTISIYDIKDYSAVSGFSIYEDNRIKFIDPQYREYPFTIEYSYEVHYNGLLSLPIWYVYDDFGVSIETSQFKLINQNNIPVRHIIIDRNNSISNIDSKTEWQAKDLKALIKEPFAPSIIEISPKIIFGPTNFKIGGFEGNFESWSNFGKWIAELNLNRQELPIETKQKVKDLTKELSNDKDKICALYKYLQNTTRYVSIQVGIGGWQPFPASIVDNYKYGDCKALTNYMCALLKECGIQSYYTLVRAGINAPAVIDSFPHNQFNHAFLCIPLPKDTIWLECTNLNNPCGYLGTFTDDRFVLVINNQNGTLLKSKSYDVNDNLFSSKLNFDIDESGYTILNANNLYRGIFYEKVSQNTRQDEQKIKENLNSRIEIPSYELFSFNYSKLNNNDPIISEQFMLSFTGQIKKINNELIIDHFPIFENFIIPARVENRKQNVLLRRPFTKIDSFKYNLPDNYTATIAYEKDSITCKFGKFIYEKKVENNSILFNTIFVVKKGVYGPEEYNNFRSFIINCNRLSSQKFFLIKKE